MSDQTGSKGDKSSRRAAERITDALQGLAFGSVEVTVHDGKIVQIERREKTRMDVPLEVTPGGENTDS